MEELSSSRYINLFTDFGFKRIFGTERNQDLLLDFLNAILEREQDPLVKIEYKDKEQVGRDADERRAVFDLYCENEKGERFIIELQKVLQQHFKDRNLYYATFALQEQAQKGKAWDYALQPVYSIALMNFVFEEAYPDQVISRVELRERSTNRLFHDKLFFVYVEMPKFKKKFSELAGNLERWLYVFQNIHRLDKAPEEIRKGVFLKLFKECEIANYQPQERMEYERSLKEARDMYSALLTAKNEGKKEGRKEGRKEGEKIKSLQVAIKAIKKGFDNKTIQELTGLSIDEIEQLRKSL